MSKLKQLMNIVNEVKDERSKSKEPGLFSYVPDSILNHQKNKVDAASPTIRGKSDMAGNKKGKGRLKG